MRLERGESEQGEQQPQPEAGPGPEAAAAQPKRAPPALQPTFQPGDRVVHPKHREYGVGLLASLATPPGAVPVKWHVDWERGQKGSRGVQQSVLQHAPPLEQQLPSKLGQRVQCLSGKHAGRQGVVEAGRGDSLVRVLLDGSAEPVWLKPEYTTVVQESQGEPLTSFPRVPIRREVVERGLLSQWIKDYEQDKDSPCQLQLVQPRARLAFDFAARLRAPEEAEKFYLGCLQDQPLAFNVTEDSNLAASAQVRVTLRSKLFWPVLFKQQN